MVARGVKAPGFLVMAAEKLDIPEKGYIDLPNGCTLYWEPDGVGGRRYITDEAACGHVVWDTAITQSSTLLAAIVQEERLRTMEAVNKERGF